MMGLRVVEDVFMTDTVEDWSQVRSPSRARRRRRQGHPQRIRYVQVPKADVYLIGKPAHTMVAHPEAIRALMAKIPKAEPGPVSQWF